MINIAADIHALSASFFTLVPQIGPLGMVSGNVEIEFPDAHSALQGAEILAGEFLKSVQQGTLQGAQRADRHGDSLLILGPQISGTGLFCELKISREEQRAGIYFQSMPGLEADPLFTVEGIRTFLTKIVSLADKRDIVRAAIASVESGEKPVDELFIGNLKFRAVLEPEGAFLRTTDDIERAILKAAELHAGQMRKAEITPRPYIVHPLRVAEILSHYGAKEDVIVSGLLHDTAEDCGYGFEQMARDFGEFVAEIVKGITEDPALKALARVLKKEGRGQEGWKRVKDAYLQGLQIASQEALMVSCADKIDNLRSILEAHQARPTERVWENFSVPLGMTLRFYVAVLEILQERLNNPALLAKYEAVCAEAEKTLREFVVR